MTYLLLAWWIVVLLIVILTPIATVAAFVDYVFDRVGR